MAEEKKQHTPLVLLILDGFGISNESYGNPVREAHTPHFDDIEARFPFTTLQASGVAVGMPWGEAGNSEVGHLTLGAGRVVYHHLPRIVMAIQNKTFFSNPAFVGAAEHVKKNNSSLHLVGLVSSGSVHSYIDHLYALFDFTVLQNIDRVFLHIFTDGKDAPPNEGGKFIPSIEERLEKRYPHISIATVIGRTYAMDRDEKWDRIKKAYALYTRGAGAPIVRASAYIKDSYKKNIYDAFLEPAYVMRPDGSPVATIKDNDAVIFFNFREDSMRELTAAFAQDTFDYFPRERIQNLYVATMTQYSKTLPTRVAFPPVDITYPLARVIGEAGMRQLHIAETEKYAHVTYFFNGGKEIHNPGEDWELIPSIATAHYDEVPEMRAQEIADRVLSSIHVNEFTLANFANADMVGHTGNYAALMKAIAALDREIGRIMEGVLARNGVLLITGDHGNAEQKISRLTGEIMTEHTINPVPLYLIGNEYIRTTPRTQDEILEKRKEIGGILTDVAPTIIELLGLQKPDEMSGKSLLPELRKQV